jgi:predicted kinase
VIERIILVVGLPGSGKSVFAKELALGLGYVWIDDPSVSFSHEQLVGRLAALNDRAKGLSISDPLLCYPHNRQAAAELLQQCCPQATLEWVYFENDPERCLANSKARSGPKTVDQFIKEASKVYRPPQLAVPVYSY